MNFYGGDTITFSLNPDFYEFRILKRNKEWSSKENSYLVKKPSWVYDKFGPFINKQKDQVFVSTGLQYVKMGIVNNTSDDSELEFRGDYLIQI